MHKIRNEKVWPVNVKCYYIKCPMYPKDTPSLTLCTDTHATSVMACAQFFWITNPITSPLDEVYRRSRPKNIPYEIYCLYQVATMGHIASCPFARATRAFEGVTTTRLQETMVHIPARG